MLLWYFLISRKATVPGLYRGFLRPGLTAVEAPLRLGAFPPVLSRSPLSLLPGARFPPMLCRPPRRAVPETCVRAMIVLLARELYTTLVP